jgi:putative DeoR family transcriptional regulator (stage III sporulation protein D)
MKQHIVLRAQKLAEYIIETKKTVRDTAKVFGYSKSTVHKDVAERLLEIDTELCGRVKEILNFNLSERHIRGGTATRRKYKKTLV